MTRTPARVRSGALGVPRLVCEGQLPLEVAQRDIAHDWIDAYKKYFRTTAALQTGSMLAVANYHPRVPNPSTEQPRAADREPPVSSRHSRTQSPSPEPRAPNPEPRAENTSRQC